MHREKGKKGRIKMENGALNYKTLSDEDLQGIATTRFGNVLRPLEAIGRLALIEELKAWDRFVALKKKNKEVKILKWD